MILPLLLALSATDRAQIMAPINATFAAIKARDGQRVLPFTTGKGGTTVANENADGTVTVRSRTWAEFAEGLKPGPEAYEEKLFDPEIRVDGDIAMVWGRYTFMIDGKLHHCGVDHFGLVKEAGAWKIATIAWSSRTKGCE
jgi:hypothetical protein